MQLTSDAARKGASEDTMSAYQVSPDTIDLLIAAAVAWRLTFPNRDGNDAAELHVCSHRDEAGQLLTDENARSVNARYNESTAAESYSWTPIDLDRAAVAMPVPVLVLASVRCLRYQSCETDNYSETRAARLLSRIEAEACRRLIDTHEAPWGFTRDWMEGKRAEIKAKVANGKKSDTVVAKSVKQRANDEPSYRAAVLADPSSHEYKILTEGE